MSDFTWTPSLASPVRTKPRVLSAQFGDGYEAVGTDGLNAIVREWQLEFTAVDVTVADAIDDFLTTKAGVTSFTWTPPKPHDTEIKVRTKDEWEIAPVGGLLRTVRVTFRRVFEP